MHKVKGRSGLLKDPSTGSVVNTDDQAFKQAKAVKERVLAAKQKEQELEDRIQRLESALESLLKDKEHG